MEIVECDTVTYIEWNSIWFWQDIEISLHEKIIMQPENRWEEI